MPYPYESQYPKGVIARAIAQRNLGMIHGVMSDVVSDVLPSLPTTPSTNYPVAILADDLNQAAMEVYVHVGTLQAALNTGQLDEGLDASFGGAQGEVKEKSLLKGIVDYLASKAKSVRDYMSSRKEVLSLCSTLVGSIASAIPREFSNVPGASAAAEAIKEFVELLRNVKEFPRNPNQESGTESKSPPNP